MTVISCLTPCLRRLMILVFTSTAFTNWVKNHVEITDDGSFNPYLTFLFFAMYVYWRLSRCLKLTHCTIGLACPLCASLGLHSTSFFDYLASKTLLARLVRPSFVLV